MLLAVLEFEVNHWEEDNTHGNISGENTNTTESLRGWGTREIERALTNTTKLSHQCHMFDPHRRGVKHSGWRKSDSAPCPGVELVSALNGWNKLVITHIACIDWYG